MELFDKITIYTDGACSGNPGPGGWAAVLICGELRREISGFEPHTTNNRMELCAAKFALEALNRPSSVDLYSDSTYLCNAYNKGWLASWKAKGFMREDGPVPNADLWEALLRLTNTHSVKFFYVRGHADNVENNRCDKLAREAIKQGRSNQTI